MNDIMYLWMKCAKSRYETSTMKMVDTYDENI